MDLYTNKINEFIDWVSGENVITGESVTGGQKVSGGRIRELLQEKLREPIVVEEDIPNNLFRFFTSDTAKNLYHENPSDNAGLQLFTVPRPSDYTLTLTIQNDGDRYVKLGDDVTDKAKMQFTWKIHNDRQTDASDVLLVTYTITNADGTQRTFTRRRNHHEAEDYPLYEFIKSGINNVSVEARGASTGALATTSFNIIVLDLRVTCGFNFAGSHARNESLRVPYTFYRNNTDASAKIYFCIDGTEIPQATVDVLEAGQLTIEDSGKMISPSLTPGQHSLQVYAMADYDGLKIYSNILYFTFVVDSNEAGAIDKFINVATSLTNGIPPFTNLQLQGIQYYESQLRWSYYTYAANTDTKLSVTWKLLEGEDDQDPQVFSPINAQTGYEPDALSYTPIIYTNTQQLYLAAYYSSQGQDTQLIRIPIQIIQNNSLIDIYETDNYELKMSAYGRTNGSEDRAIWKDETDTVSTTFTGIDWNPNSGWYENSFRTSGQGHYAVINFEPFLRKDPNDTTFPFTYGKTIEIEFESEKVSDDSDKLIVIGNPDGARIEITPNTATLYSNKVFDQDLQEYVDSEIVHTNYKSNERIKLAFIINKSAEGQANKTVDDGLAYIVNNGILERGAIASGRSFNTSGTIKIGGSNSGVRVYNIRIYDKSISYSDAYNNFVYDSSDKVSIVNRNNILKQGSISFDKCRNMIDTIVITGDLSNILDQTADKDDSTTDVMIERYCYYDETKDFQIGDIIDDPDRPGKQKVVNGCQIRKHGQSTLNYPIASMKFWMNKSKSGETPIFEKTGQSNLMLNKNRYKMKNSSIPANKFVLQANYADSSGVHNGGLLRLIQDSWYNARIAGVSDPYKLRTLPQLFSSLKSNEKQNYGLDHVWADYFPKNDFPYNIRIAPDSFPCAVFYKDLSGSGQYTFLGQYVFMDDKKSDFCFGERSIYKVQADPFCLTVTHKDEDTKDNRIWSNENVLQIEVLEVNKSYSSYVTDQGFDTYSGGRYGWESQFEMIYPDPDDIEKDDEKDGLQKSNPNSKFAKTAKPFVDWYKWLISTRNNHEKFRAEAEDHLDLYKLAAYYIFVLRFALVDSLERNAQIKTYDGVHFHYEPWDMDIALGNKNDGGIAFNPPVDRNTKLNTTTYAISGRSADQNGDIISSNWLWDALEAWPRWINDIVPKVADALFNTGILTYNNVSNMFDNEYANKWCEIMYNKSGHFKYVQSAGGDLQRWLGWLQGARMSHRHWWLSTSMDYYDAKWFCGDYKSHRIYLAANLSADPNKYIRIMPNGSTYMTVTVNYLDDNNQEIEGSEEVDTTREVSKLLPLTYSMAAGASTKAPIHIYGANFMESIDMSDLATGIDALDITGTYSDVLGAPLRELNVGTPIIGSGHTFTTTLSPSTCGVSPVSEGKNAFENLETLNIRGHKHLGNVQQFTFGINQWIRDLNMTQLKNFYAMGSGLINFYSSNDGNSFNDIELPSSVSILNIKNSTWNNMTFWDTSEGLNDQATLTYHQTEIDTNIYTNVPPTITEVHFLGSTGRTRESLLFVREWLRSIVATYGESALSGYTLEMDDVFWSSDVIGNDADLLTYDELRLISMMNGPEPTPGSGVTKTHPIRGYVMLQYEGEGTELSAQQLTYIRNWFGDSVFTKGSAGLVVDYKHDYIQINIGGDVTLVEEVDPQTGNTVVNTYMIEGGNAILSATEFHLAEPDQQSLQNYVWALSEHGSSEPAQQIYGVSIEQSQRDHNWYLLSSESQVGHDYQVDVKVAAGGVTYITTINIIAAKYPSSIFLDVQQPTTGSGNISSIRTAGNIATLYQNGMSCNIFAATNDSSYTAKINSIVYTITNGEYTTTYSSTAGPTWSGDVYNVGDHLNVQESTQTLGMGNTKCIKATGMAIPYDDTIYEYTVTAVIEFESNKRMTATKKILVMKDNAAIVSVMQEHIYSAFASAWNTQFGEQLTKSQLYRTDLLSMNGTLTFNSSVQNIMAYSGSNSILAYLPNITGLVFDDNSNLTSIYTTLSNEQISQFVFDGMPNLQTLSIQNCTGLTADIDLSNNPDIVEVDASGTTINVILPTNPKVTKYELGAPTSVNISNPTVLTPSGVVVDSYANITSLDIVNIPNNNTYAMFDKIMSTYVVGGVMHLYKIQNNTVGQYSDWGVHTTSPINVENVSSLSIETDSESYTTHVYLENGTRKWNFNNSSSVSLSESWLGDIYWAEVEIKQGSTYLRVINADNDTILFEWRA